MTSRWAVTVTGSRSVGHRSHADYVGLFETYLRPFANEKAQFFVGGAAGIDTLALDWPAAESPAALTVVVPCTVSDQAGKPAESIIKWNRAGRLAKVVELGAAELTTASYHVRNRWMIDRSDFVIGFPHGDDRRRVIALGSGSDVDKYFTALRLLGVSAGRVDELATLTARYELRPWRDDASVRDLDDHLHDTLLGR